MTVKDDWHVLTAAIWGYHSAKISPLSTRSHSVTRARTHAHTLRRCATSAGQKSSWCTVLGNYSSAGDLQGHR
jgi:hypothetical protein